MSQTLNIATRYANKWLDELDTRNVNATANIDELKKSFDGPLPEAGTAPEDVIEHLAQSASDGLLGSAGGRFFAWVIGGSTESALAADWLISTWEQNAALYHCGPAVSVIEDIAGKWMKQLFFLPPEASFAFTTGCQLAHFTCLAAARHQQLVQYDWNVEKDGLFGAPRISVFVNPERHGSVVRALRYLGIGERNIVPLDVDNDGILIPDLMRQKLKDTEGPKILVLNAADLNIGACDNFSTLIPIAHNEDTWVHIDGAFGLFANVSDKYNHLVKGIELADSWATDAHKWLNVPFDCGMAIIRNSEAHKATMTLSASYIEAGHGARDQIDWNPEWSRRARGVPVYAALKELGRSGVANLVERSCSYCKALTLGISALEGAHLVYEPTLNQGLVRFERAGASDAENDAYVKDTIERINQTGEAFFSGTLWRGRQAMRISVVNWRTSQEDVDRSVAAVKLVLVQDAS